MGNGLVVTLINVYDGTSDDASTGFGVDVYRKSKRANICVILNKIDFLDEERWRLDRPTLYSGQAAGVRVNPNATLEQASAFLARLHLVSVHRASFQLACPLVGELVVRGADRVQRRVVLLHMIHFGLQQPDDDIGLHEVVARKSYRLECERTRSQIALLHFVFARL